MTKKTTFNKKLAAYSVLAAAGIASIGAVDAQVVYVDITPDVTVAPLDSFLLDLDTDAQVDFKFKDRVSHQANIFNSAYYNYAIASAGFTGGFYYGIVLNLNDPIDPSDTRFQMGQVVLASTWSSSTYGNFGDGVDHYVGLKFQIGANNYHNGWVRVNCGSITGHPYVIKDYAYESTVNTSILAGQTSSDINDLPMDMVSVWSFNNDINVNFGPVSYNNAVVKVYNNAGQLVLTEEINSQKTKISMETQAAGMYMVQITNGNSVLNKKISL